MSAVANQISQSSQRIAPGGLKKVWGVQGGRASSADLRRREIVRHHVAAVWSQLINSPRYALVTTLIMAVVLSLCVTGVLVIDNTRRILEHARSSVGLTIFLRDDASGEEARKLLVEYFRADARVASARFESKEEALEVLRSETPAVSALLQGLDARNPLPSSFSVRVVESESTPAIYQELRQRFQEFPGVELVQYNNSLLGELSDALHLLTWLGGVSVVGMLLVASFIVALTIVISVDRRREEIVIMRLVGATERFIRTPFILEGMVKGVCGGIFGIVATFFGFQLARGVFESTLPFVPIWDRVEFLPWWLVAGVLLVVAIVGGVASLVAVRRAITPMDA